MIRPMSFLDFLFSKKSEPEQINILKQLIGKDTMKDSLFKVWQYYLSHPEKVAEYWSSGMVKSICAFRIFPMGWDKQYGIFIEMSGDTYKAGYKKYNANISHQQFLTMKAMWDKYKFERDEIGRAEYNNEVEKDKREMEELAESI